MSRQPVMHSVKGVAALLLSATAMAASCERDLWDVGHHTGDRLRANRPECPVMWDTIPLAFNSKQVDSIKTQYGRELPPSILARGSGLVFTPSSVTSPDGFTTQDGDLPLSGPITNIPEFHDCQRFLSADGASFDSLFAIFASFRMDATMQSLTWINIATWTSADPGIASVEPNTGIVTGHVGGSTQILGVDTQGNAVGPFPIMVTGPAVPAGTAGPSLAMGPGTPPATIAPNEERKLVLQYGGTTPSTFAAATIFSYGPGHAELGIGQNFNCLYVYFDSTKALRAKMVWVNRLDEYQHACLNAVDPVHAPGTELSVIRSMANVPGINNSSALYPAVARWDSDSATGKPYIGIKCFDAWCEIGSPDNGGFKPSARYLVSAAPATDQKVIQVKGWYDEQILAAPQDNDPDKLRPSGLRGTVIPAPTLDALTKVAMTPLQGDDDPWTLVAYVAIRELASDPGAVDFYRKTLGLEPVPMGALQTLNQMFYCYGTRDTCIVPSGEAKCDSFLEEWGLVTTRVWVKVVAATGATKYRCVTRRGHPAFTGNVPATARWRWILADDTIWTACIQGCCQTETGGE